MTPYAQMIGNQLRPEAQSTFAYEYNRYSKDQSVALLLTLILGLVGGEAYYFGEYKRGILMSIALFTGIGILISFPLWIVRCFTIQNECEAYNDYVAYMIASRYWSQTQFNNVAPPPPQEPVNVSSRRPNISGLPMRAH